MTFPYFKKIIYLLLLIIISAGVAQAQEPDKPKVNPILSALESDTSLLELEPDTVLDLSKKKKKKKKKIFYGYKCRKGGSRTIKGDNMTLELFFFLKTWEEPDPYVPEKFFFDVRSKKIVMMDEIKPEDKPFLKILHGPYKKMYNGTLVEEGVFYIGTKHARWEVYGGEKVLLDKTKYYKGWLKSSQITYYDPAKTKVKEVTQYEHDRLHGDYYYFLENGAILTRGRYMDGKKVGTWVEYQTPKYRKKKETAYPKDPYRGEQFEPYVLNEWDENGMIIIQNGKPVPKKEEPKQKEKKKFGK